MTPDVKQQLNKNTGSAYYAGARQIPETKELTAQQRLFVKGIAEGDSPANAYVRAGYKSPAAKDKGASKGGYSYAYRMMEMPNIKRAIQLEREQYIQQSQMTKKAVMDGLLEGIEMAKLMSEPMTMISGWREVGKLCGFYEPVRHKVDVSVNGALVLEQMNTLSDEELLRMISEGSAQALLPALGAPSEYG